MSATSVDLSKIFLSTVGSDMLLSPAKDGDLIICISLFVSSSIVSICLMGVLILELDVMNDQVNVEKNVHDTIHDDSNIEVDFLGLTYLLNCVPMLIKNCELFFS